jgi:hypothetical protein
MKTKFAILAALCLCVSVAIFTGCKTTNSQQSTIKLAAYVGTSEALLQHPEWKPKFEIAASDLYTLESSTNIDAASILAIASRLPVKELKSDRARIYVTAATLLISDYAGTVPLEQIAELKPVATAIREGVELALRD